MSRECSRYSPRPSDADLMTPTRPTASFSDFVAEGKSKPTFGSRLASVSLYTVCARLCQSVDGTKKAPGDGDHGGCGMVGEPGSHRKHQRAISSLQPLETDRHTAPSLLLPQNCSNYHDE